MAPIWYDLNDLDHVARADLIETALAHTIACWGVGSAGLGTGPVFNL